MSCEVKLEYPDGSIVTNQKWEVQNYFSIQSQQYSTIPVDNYFYYLECYYELDINTKY